MQRLGNTGQNMETRQLQISGQADAECSPGPIFAAGNRCLSYDIFFLIQSYSHLSRTEGVKT